jgi:hypothetical protein
MQIWASYLAATVHLFLIKPGGISTAPVCTRTCEHFFGVLEINLALDMFRLQNTNANLAKKYYSKVTNAKS